MILYRGGNRSQLHNLPWHVLTITNYEKPETTLRNLGQHLQKQKEPIEVFVPETAEVVFVRTKDQQALTRLKQVRGIQGFLSTERLTGEDVVEYPITVPDAEVQQMIQK